MSASRPRWSLTGVCLLAAAAVPILVLGTQIVAVPFYPGFNFSRLSVSMLGTRFSREPWIFNVGEILAGLAALAGALGLYRSFRGKTYVLLSVLIGFSVAANGVMTLKAGMFPTPDPRHNSWALLFNFAVLTPFLLLIGLLKQRGSAALRIYLVFSVLLLLLLIPFIPRLGRGVAQDLIAVGTTVPIGVVGFSFWRELRRGSRASIRLPGAV